MVAAAQVSVPRAEQAERREVSAYRSIEIDLHRTLTRADHSPDLGPMTPGSAAALKKLQNEKVLIFLACAGFRDPKFEPKVRAWLHGYGVDPDQRIIYMPDPQVVALVNDRAIQFTGHNWPAITDEVMGRLNRPDPSASPLEYEATCTGSCRKHCGST